MTKDYLIERNGKKYEVVIGLEVHAQVLSESKLFSTSPTKFGSEPNTQVSLVDAAFPGMLPVINEFCIKQAIKTGIGLNAKINNKSIFDRKNYFYADLPQGYQISQYDKPLALQGIMPIDVDGQQKDINVTRVHLEEDVAKLSHLSDSSGSYSVVDINRAGVALMEIVSEPDMRSAEEARQYLMNMHSMVQYLGVSNANMEDGNFRCDANVSVRPKGQEEFGTRTEIKNMNSFRSVVSAIEYETQRQIDVIESGGKVVQETRGWVDDKQVTASQRSKEQAHDYRYFPEPDLPPLIISAQMVEEIKALLPELPSVRKERFINDLDLTEYEADLLTSEKATADYFENVVDKLPEQSDRYKPIKTTSNFILGDLTALMKDTGENFSSCSLSPNYLAELVMTVVSGDISVNIAKNVLAESFKTQDSPSVIIERNNYAVISDTDVLFASVETVVANNTKAVEDYKSGKESAAKFLVGQVMKETKGQAKPDVVAGIVLEVLSKY